MESKEISIVICTHRHVELARGAVQSLIDQTASPDCYEVLLVDNDARPNPGFQDIVAQASRRISIRYLHEQRSGLSFARNTGGEVAGADFVGYVDDDARANPRYVESVVRIIRDIQPDICGGPHEPFYLDRRPKWFLDRYGSDSKGDRPRYLSPREYLIGLNMVFRRGLLEELGWFDTNLSQVGYKRMGGEDTMMQIRAWGAHPDLRVYYDPALLVQHLVPARKMSLINHARMLFDMGVSQIYFWMPEGDRAAARRQAPLNLLHILANLGLRTAPGIVFRDRRRYPYWQNYLYETGGQRAYALGAQVRLLADRWSSLFSTGSGERGG